MLPMVAVGLIEESAELIVPVSLLLVAAVSDAADGCVVS